MNAFFSWIRSWARDAASSVTDVRFLRRTGHRKAGQAVGHLAMLAVLWTIPVTVLFFLGLRSVVGHVGGILRSDLPPGTVFEMKDGRLTNNLTEPLIFREEDSTVIINSASSTLTLAEGEDGLVVDALGITTQEGGQRDDVSFRGAPDFRVDREGLIERMSRWAPLGLFLGSLFVLVFVFLLGWAGLLVGGLVYGVILWLAFKALRRPQTWRSSFIVAAYATTAAALARFLTQGFEPLSFVPGLVTWLYLAWVAYDAWKEAPSPGGDHGRTEEGGGERRPDQDGPHAAA